MTERSTTRRGFLAGAVAGAVGAGMLGALPRGAFAQEQSPQTPPKSLGMKKAVGWAMLMAGKTPEEKFSILKEAGFDGVEMNAPDPGVNVDEVNAAAKKTGIVVHGVVDSVHWKDRLSDPDEAVRARGLEGLKQALRDAKRYGASTVLLVPGRVANAQTENFGQCWERSIAEVRKAIPVAEETGVKIAIEDVWNKFIEKPEQFTKYVDEVNSPWVGAYFDIGNIVKFGTPPSEWVRQLGKRTLKLHVKGYSNAKGWVDIGDGDEDWPEIRKALAEVGYDGWATAEVKGGGLKELKEIKRRMDLVLGA